MNKAGNLEAPVENSNGQLDLLLMKEIEGHVQHALENLRDEHRSLAVTKLTMPLLSEGEGTAIQRVIQRVFLRQAVVPRERIGAAQHCFVVPRNPHAANSKEIAFAGRTATLLEDFIKRCNAGRTVHVALGLYLDRWSKDHEPRLSIAEVATLAGITYSYAKRDLRQFCKQRLHSPSEFRGGWKIIFEQDEEHFSFEHQDSATSIAKQTFARFLRTEQVKNHPAALQICTLLIEKYLTDGSELTLQEIAKKTRLDDCQEMKHFIKELN